MSQADAALQAAFGASAPAGNAPTGIQSQADAALSAAFAPAPAEKSFPQKAMGFMSDYTSALIHHAMNPLHGAAQLIENGVAKGADLIDPAKQTLSTAITGERPRSGWNQAIQDAVARDNKALRDREANYQASTPDSAGSYLGAGVGEVLPYMAGPGKTLVTSAGDAAANAAARIGAPKLAQALVNGGTQGAVMGAVSPSTGDDYWSQKATQAGVGAVAGAALPAVVQGAKGAYKVVKKAAAPILAPEAAVNDTLRAAVPQNPAGPTGAAQSAPNATNSVEYVPGSRPTLAQAMGSPELVQLEKAFGNTPEGKVALTQRELDNNQARLSAIQNVAGTDSQLQAAIDARKEATQPLLDKVLNNPKTSQPVRAQPILEQLDKIGQSSFSTDPVIKKALAGIRSQIEDAATKTNLGDYTFTPSQLKTLKDGEKYIRPDLLDGIRQNLRNVISDNSSTGAVSSKQEAGLEPLKNFIASQIEQSNPGYRDYLATYAKASQPINSMEAGRAILEGLNGGRDAAGNPNIQLTRYNSLLAKALKGEYGVSPEAETALTGVQKDLQRASISNSLKSPGSDTLYNANAAGILPRLLYGNDFKGGVVPKATGGALGAALGSLVGHPIYGAGVGMAAASKAPAMAASRYNDALANALLNPDYAANLAAQNSLPVTQSALANALQNLPILSAVK